MATIISIVWHTLVVALPLGALAYFADKINERKRVETTRHFLGLPANMSDKDVIRLGRINFGVWLGLNGDPSVDASERAWRMLACYDEIRRYEHTIKRAKNSDEANALRNQMIRRLEDLDWRKGALRD